VRHKLIDQIGGEVGEFVLELELDARGQERRALEQARRSSDRAGRHQAAETLGDSRIFLREFAGLLAQERELAIVEFRNSRFISSEPIDFDLAGVELDLGDEFDRHA
jgi:hypothetical protein